MKFLINPLTLLLSTILVLSACQKRNEFKDTNLIVGLNTQHIESPDDTNLVLDHKSKVKSFEIAIYNQKINNKEIEDSYLKKLISPNGQLIGLVAQTTDRKIDNKKSMHFESKSLADVKSELFTKYPELKSKKVESLDWMYVLNKSNLEPVYKIIYSESRGEIIEAKYDVNLQLISKNQAGSQFSDVDAFVYPRGPKLSQLENVTLKSIEVDNGIRSLNFKISSLISSKIQNPAEIPKIQTSDDRFDEVQVSYYIQKSFDWFTKSFNAQIPLMVDIQLNVGAPEKSNTAFYYANKIRFGSGDDVVYANIPRDPTIIIHESNHAIIDYLAHLPFDKEGGSINEGLADFLTTLQLNHPNLGEVAFLKGPFRRTVKNDLKFNDRTGGLYGDSAIISGLLWNLKEALGDELAGKTAVNTLMLLGPKSDFNDFKKKIQFVVKTDLKDKNLENAEKILKDRGWM
jgi:Zn-dependent metalloprotease